MADQIKNNSELKEKIRSIEQKVPNHIHLKHTHVIEKEFLNNQDLMIVSAESWKKLMDGKTQWLSSIPSALILKEHV